MKTITMMQLRANPGEYAFRVRADGESFLVTYQGKPCFKMVPVDETTVVRPDGSWTGPKPLTFRENLGDEYGECSARRALTPSVSRSQHQTEAG